MGIGRWGESFIAIDRAPPGRLIGAQGAQELRASDGVWLYGSDDRGQSWAALTAFPTTPGRISVDPTDIARVAVTEAIDLLSGMPTGTVWLYDGMGWTTQIPDPAARIEVVRWRDGDLVLAATRDVFLRSETGSPPFTEIPWFPLDTDTPTVYAVDRQWLLAAGTGSVAGDDAIGWVGLTDGVADYRHPIVDFDNIVGIAVTETSIVVAAERIHEIEWW